MGPSMSASLLLKPPCPHGSCPPEAQKPDHSPALACRPRREVASMSAAICLAAPSSSAGEPTSSFTRPNCVGTGRTHKAAHILAVERGQRLLRLLQPLERIGQPPAPRGSPPAFTSPSCREEGTSVQQQACTSSFTRPSCSAKRAVCMEGMAAVRQDQLPTDRAFTTNSQRRESAEKQLTDHASRPPGKPALPAGSAL